MYASPKSKRAKGLKADARSTAGSRPVSDLPPNRVRYVSDKQTYVQVDPEDVAKWSAIDNKIERNKAMAGTLLISFYHWFKYSRSLEGDNDHSAQVLQAMEHSALAQAVGESENKTALGDNGKVSFWTKIVQWMYFEQWLLTYVSRSTPDHRTNHHVQTQCSLDLSTPAHAHHLFLPQVLSQTPAHCKDPGVGSISGESGCVRHRAMADDFDLLQIPPLGFQKLRPTQ